MQLNLEFRPTPVVISAVRSSVAMIVERYLSDRDVATRIAIATQELLENVLRHSQDGDAELSVHADQDTHRVVIETRSKADAAKVDDLARRIREMLAHDAMEYYAQTIAAVAESEEDGGLGLARIYAEADMTLDVQRVAEEVRVIATTRLGEAA